MDEIENRTFDEIRVGDSAELTRVLTGRDADLFAIVSGDVCEAGEGAADLSQLTPDLLRIPADFARIGGGK